jgi:Ribonuclease T2 family
MQKDTSFDVLIFTQHYPITVCAKWMEQNKNHECQLPKQKNMWEIHGELMS